ncbi:YybH family protein [Ferrimonas balearica]|uniref:YybH family protein n=1 Tax=Ferrimonas balearica TaxID=44012 RepID=UPI001C9A149F|nr:nuclear transport factor 2 family protein [Ferrimonas balearica]MBY5920099.1 nuclear transport factor 2 family protein [Ferrimonas balearica]MBY5997216.1 nuclear transport factor 2 family protein [Ferrimonas balearica]
MKLLIPTLALMFSVLVTPVRASTDSLNQEINELYDTFVESYFALDPEPLESLYSPDACLMGVSDESEFIRGREAITKAINKWFEKVRKRDATIKIDFRVIERQHEGAVVTDAGYYLIRYTPNQASEQPSSEFAGKFVMSFKRGADGNWYIFMDSANRSKPELFYAASAEPGLYFSNPSEIMQAELPKK